MMRFRTAATLCVLAVFAGGCTAFVAAELSGDQGSGPAIGSCFQLPDNQCGSCIATQCEQPDQTPPVSLAQVCSIGGSDLPYTVQECANNPSVAVYYDDYCSQLFQDGGTYASGIDTLATAENNVELCIRDQCETSCRTCSTPVTVCNSDTTPLEDAGGCGACLYNAMSQPGAQCQGYLIANTYSCGEISTELSNCATPTGSSSCVSPDCTGLWEAGIPLSGCLHSACGSACPN